MTANIFHFTPPFTPEVFILDVDGVMTDGSFYYTDQGKVMKRFGPDDSDAISMLVPHLAVRFISGDKRGFPITAKRIVDDMHCQLDMVSTVRRVEWIAENYSLDKVIYMGDGLFDTLVFSRVGFAIAPANANAACRAQAQYVTQSSGGERAVAEACLYILSYFYDMTSIEDLLALRYSPLWK